MPDKAQVITVPNDFQFSTGNLQKQIPGVQLPEEPGPSAIGRAMPEALPMFGGIAGSSIPGVGNAGGVSAGIVLKNILKNAFPQTFGDPGSLGEQATGAGIDLATQAGIPAAVNSPLSKKIAGKFIGSGIISKFPSVRRQLEGGVEQEMNKFKFPQSDIVETAASNAQGTHATMAPGVPGGTNIPGFEPGTIGEDLLKVPYQQVGTATTPIGAVAKKALSDVTQVRNFKIATGEPYTIEQLAMNKLFTEGAGKRPIDLINALDGPEADIYKEAIRPSVRNNLNDLLEQADKYSSHNAASKVTDYALRYTKTRLVLGASGIISGNPYAMTGGSLILADTALGKLAANPDVTKLALGLMKTPSAQNNPLLSKPLLLALRGTTAILRIPGQQDQTVKIDQDGNVVNQK